MSSHLRSLCVIVLFGLVAVGARLIAQEGSLSPEHQLELEHADPQWPTIQAHLPDPATARANALEMSGDILRARRFPEDALNYYMYAVRAGGNEVSLLNKMGIVELELWRPMRARAYFERVIKLKKKDPEGWNNLGATEYIEGRDLSAIYDYSRAIKLNKRVASYHSNLGTVYMEKQDFGSARKQFKIALKLDPSIFEHHGSMGVTARLLSTDDRARFCYEMARVYAEGSDTADMLHYLQMATEGGFNILGAMERDAILERYRKDPRVLMLVSNARALRSNRASVQTVAGELPPVQKPLQQPPERE